MPSLADSWTCEVSRKPGDVIRNPSPSGRATRAKEPKPGFVRSVPSYPPSPSSSSRRQSPARVRPLTSNASGVESSFEGFGIRVPDVGIRVPEAGKSLRSNSPARTYQSSPYLTKVYEVPPSQKSASTKGRSVSRERGARMSTGKVSSVNEPQRAPSSRIIANLEPTSPASSYPVRGSAAVRKGGTQAEGKSSSAYLDRLSVELAESVRGQTANHSNVWDSKVTTTDGQNQGLSRVTVGSVSMGNRSLAQGRLETVRSGSTRNRAGDTGLAQDRLRQTTEPSIHERFRQQREEALSGPRSETSALGSQRKDRSAMEKQGLDGSRKPGAANSGLSGSTKAQLRKQSGLDDFAEISVKVEELLRVSRSTGADLSVPRGGGANPRPESADVSSGSSSPVESPSARGSRRPGRGVVPSLGGGSVSSSVERKRGGPLIEARGRLRQGTGEDSPSSGSSFDGTRDEGMGMSPQSSSTRWEKSVSWSSDVRADSNKEQGATGEFSNGPLSAGNSSLAANRGVNPGVTRTPRGDVCTDVISDGDDDVRGIPQQMHLAPVSPIDGRDRGDAKPLAERDELTLDDIPLTSSSESDSDSEGDRHTPRAKGRRRHADVSSRSRGDVSSDDVSISPNRDRIRSPESFGSDSPDSLSSPARGDPLPRPKTDAGGGLDFRLGTQTDTPLRQKSAKIVPLSDASIARPTIGLRNLGNTCFLNSILQCLISTPPLSAALATLQDSALQQSVDLEKVTGAFSPGVGSSPRPRLVGPLVRLLRGMTEARPYSSVNPQELLARLERWAPQFADGDQHDSQEALRIIMEALDMDCSRIRSQPPYRELASTGAPPEKLARDAWAYHRSRHDSVIQDIFSGQLQSTVECLDCGLQSHCFDPFLDLSLPLPKPSKNASDAGAWFSPGRSVTLAQCLAAFTTEEELEEHHHCDRCKAAKPATKKLAVFQLPRVLVLHIKRISGARFSLFSKDSTTVDFPLEGLDMRPSLSDDALPSQGADALYDLLAVSNHSGSMTGGHYTAYCKETASRGATWHCYNDSSVLEMPSSQVVSSSAYVLFYQRRL